MQVLQGLVQRVLSNMTPKGGPGSENNIKYDTLEGGGHGGSRIRFHGHFTCQTKAFIVFKVSNL